MVPNTMEAIQFDPKSLELSLVSTSLPSVDVTQVLVKVAYSGICGTDLHTLQGSFPCADRLTILGHEFSGVVVAIGYGVTNVKIGDNVAVDPNRACDTCAPCSGGQYHFCEIGGINATGKADGGWAQYCLVSDSQVYQLPKTITLEHGALSEPISCVSHGWDRLQPVPVGSHILITGAGIIGNLWAAVLHVQGHRKVVISEPQEERRKLTARLETGFDIISPSELKQRKEKDPSYGFDLVIDCSGYGPAIEEALWMLNCGGRLCIFGVASPNTRISVSPYHLYKHEINIISVNINPFSFPKALGLMDAMRSRYLDYDRLGVKVFTLKQYKEAIEQLKKGSIAKAVFKIDH